jgi:drug/metabolite transporter (DMT)-like permease
MFFAFTFILNRSMNLTGGYWMWSSCLRYMITLVLFTVFFWATGRRQVMDQAIGAIKAAPATWLTWSTVGFGGFYFFLTMASQFGESWLVAASWQMTIVCGILLTPLFDKPIPLRNLLLSMLILAGVFLLQAEHFGDSANLAGDLLSLVPIVIAAFCYPLGNRKMMQSCPPDLGTLSRVYGMILASIPCWILVAIVAWANAGLPGRSQLIQVFCVALFSGCIATSLFFHATDLVKHNLRQLAVVEATQSGEVIFTLLGGVIFLGDPAPSLVGFAGIFLVVAGMIIESLLNQ